MAELTFVGTGRADASAELAPPTGAPVDRRQLRSLAAAHEDAGFHAVLVGGSDTSPHALVIAGQILHETERLGAIVGLAPHLLAPTAAARALATLEALHPGRVGAALPAHPARAEYADVLTLTWTSPRPFDYDGTRHRAAGAWSAVRPAAGLPLWVTGGDEDVPTARRLHRLRPIVAATPRAAQDYAERVLRVYRGPAETPAAALREATGAHPGQPPLIGPPDEVAAALLAHAAAGMDAVLLAGWSPLTDVPLFGEVIAAVHTERSLT